MTVRKRRKKNKLRGNRTHGKGDTKNKRGAGSRGGRGRAGSHKHKYSIYYGVFGTEKKKLRGKTRLPAINIEEIPRNIPEWEKQGLLEKTGKGFLLDGKKIRVSKIIGRGTASFPIFLKNVSVSAKAKKKIEQAGGKILETEEEEKAEGGETE